MAGVRIASRLKAASMSVGQNGLVKLTRKLKNDRLLTAVSVIREGGDSMGLH